MDNRGKPWPSFLAAKNANNAIPTTDKAIGRVAKDFTGVNFDPIIPLRKTVTGAAVKAKIWLKISNERFLFIKRINTYQPYTKPKQQQHLI